MTERQKILLRCAISYVLANRADMIDDFSNYQGEFCFNGEPIAEPTEDEYLALINLSEI